MGAVIEQYVVVLAPSEVGSEVLGAYVHYLAAYFHEDNILVALSCPDILQRLFDFITDFLCQVGLRTNVMDTVIMACQS